MVSVVRPITDKVLIKLILVTKSFHRFKSGWTVDPN